MSVVTKFLKLFIPDRTDNGTIISDVIDPAFRKIDQDAENKDSAIENINKSIEDLKENKLDKGAYNGDAQSLKDEIDEKQNKQDNSLETKEKNIVGAINELLNDKLPKNAIYVDRQTGKINDIVGDKIGLYFVGGTANGVIDAPTYYGGFALIYPYQGGRTILWWSYYEGTAFLGRLVDGVIYEGWAEILTGKSDTYRALIGAKYGNIFIQNQGTKEKDNVYIDTDTKKPYVCLETTNDVSVTNKFRLVSNAELDKQINYTFNKEINHQGTRIRFNRLGKIVYVHILQDSYQNELKTSSIGTLPPELIPAHNVNGIAVSVGMVAELKLFANNSNNHVNRTAGTFLFGEFSYIAKN